MKRPRVNDLPAKLTLLHLDDHDDFMSPRIFFQNAKWRDGISGRPLSLLLPETVESSIKSGAIGIGSFIAPLLHLLPEVDIRHLCATEYTSARKGLHIVETISLPDNLLDPGALRPALRLQPANMVGDSLKRVKGHPYIVTDDTSKWLSNLSDGPIFLHIDMDYFNNRFDGDSDRLISGPKYDPPLVDILDRIDVIFDAMDAEGIIEQIADLSIALSPGFFPADLWAPSIKRIWDRVEKFRGEGRWKAGE